MKLLVDSLEFWESLSNDINLAQDYIFIQTLSFEGDKVGKMLTQALLMSKAKDIRILVDSYTKFILSDRFLLNPRNFRILREAFETIRMIGKLKKHGIKVKFTNPVGLFLLRFVARNHKKIILIDGKAYIGGINFSEHNFTWHDIMLMIDDEGVVKFLMDDFLATWNGENRRCSAKFYGLELHILDGVTNEDAFEGIMRLIDGAKRRIFIESPYLTFPFSDKLGEASRRGVEVVMVSPDKNNKRWLREYIIWKSKRLGFDLRLFEGMTHLKAMLIDDEFLILGSSNFDYLSYRVHQEVIAVVQDRKLISEFKDKVEFQDLTRSRKLNVKVDMLKGYLRKIWMKALGDAVVALSKV